MIITIAILILSAASLALGCWLAAGSTDATTPQAHLTAGIMLATPVPIIAAVSTEEPSGTYWALLILSVLTVICTWGIAHSRTLHTMPWVRRLRRTENTSSN